MTYNFMGACSYYLVVTSNFSVEAENVPCFGGNVASDRDYDMPESTGRPTCTRSVTIRWRTNDTTVTLGEGKSVAVDGRLVEKLPVNVPGLARIREQSTSFIQVVVTNGVEVRWDGQSNVYIFASQKLEGLTKVTFKNG